MKLSRLLEIHRSSESAAGSQGAGIGLPGNLGDAYLCKNNVIYRRIRQEAISLGYQYTDRPEAAYMALPLSQLRSILNSRRIPYFNNVSVLQEIEKTIPGQTEWGEIRDNLKKNFLFHESCHAVAHGLAEDLPDTAPLLNFLIEESFANTCELIGVVGTLDVAHKIFYEWNSYTALHENRRNLEVAMQDIGPAFVVRWILLSYLHANFLFDQFTEDQFTRVLKLAMRGRAVELTLTQMKTLRALAKICFGLDEQFRRVTTGFYLKLSGVRQGVDQLANFVYFAKLETDQVYQDYLSRLVEVLTKDVAEANKESK